jgi:hypothetical protein
MAAVLYVKINKSGKLLGENRNSSSRIQTRHAKRLWIRMDPDPLVSMADQDPIPARINSSQ